MAEAELSITDAGEEISKALRVCETRFFPSLVAVGGVKPHPEGSKQVFPPNSFSSGFLIRYRETHYLMTCGHSTFDHEGEYDPHWTVNLALPGLSMHEAGSHEGNVSTGNQRFFCTRSWLTGGIVTEDTVDVGLIELPRPQELLEHGKTFFELPDPPLEADEPFWNPSTIFCVLGFPSAHSYTFAYRIESEVHQGKLAPAVRLLDTLVAGSHFESQGGIFSFDLMFTDQSNDQTVLESLYKADGVRGMSGGPCFAVVPDGDGWVYKLCGIQIGAVLQVGCRPRLICQNLRVWLREFG